MRVLVTGAGGLVGGRLALLLAPDFDVRAGCHLARPPPGLVAVPLDLLSPASLGAAIDHARPDAIVHAAALADADRCEGQPAEAEAVNVQASADLARRCARQGIRLAALSTDLVFRGTGSFYKETERPEPILTYGRTKLRGEEAILAQAPGSVVLRVSLVHGRGYGPRPTASEAIAWALRARRTLRLFTDQYRTPVDTASLAAALSVVLRGRGQGLYHLGGPERLSRHALGLRVASALGLPPHGIEAATQAAMSLAAPRPADVSLDSSRAVRELGWAPRGVEDAVREGRAGPDIIAAGPAH